MPGRSFDVAVLGAGPAGLVAALRLAERGDVALVVDRFPREDDPPRIDAVPASFVALLVELGIHPRTVGAEGVRDQRWVAWSARTPRIRRLAPTVHLERPRLECALLEHVVRHPRIALFLSRAWNRADGLFWGDGWRAARLVDATGRAAVTADTILRAAHPWAARSLWRSVGRDGRGPDFALTALPEGYAYRITTRRAVVVGFVGRGAAVEGAPGNLEERLRSLDAAWMIADLPPLASFHEGRASTASVQWAAPSSRSIRGPRPLRIGDAALARDPLSSQGIATACSEALFVASVASDTDADLFERRQAEQRQIHLAALKRMVDASIFSRESIWRDYAEFITRHLDAPTGAPPVALREGKIVQLRANG